jgi:hypothetical protein
MKVILEASLFTHDTYLGDLVSISRFAVHERHKIVVENDAGEEYASWLAGLPDSLRADWQQGIDFSVLNDAVIESRFTLRVAAVTTPDWNDTPRVSLTTAIDFLSRPFVILLENGINDSHFLLAMCNSEEATFLRDFERRGYISFGNGGGITEIPRILDAYVPVRLGASMQYWVIFDSDARRPGEPSAQATSVIDKCIGLKVGWHALTRRARENYLPKNALRLWTFSQRNRHHERLFGAFLSLRDEQRFHYNMKKGFEGDRATVALAGDLYDDVGEPSRKALANGFGTSIGDLFQTSVVLEDVQRDGARNEFEPVIGRLIQLIR